MKWEHHSTKLIRLSTQGLRSASALTPRTHGMPRPPLPASSRLSRSRAAGRFRRKVVPLLTSLAHAQEIAAGAWTRARFRRNGLNATSEAYGTALVARPLCPEHLALEYRITIQRASESRSMPPCLSPLLLRPDLRLECPDILVSRSRRLEGRISL
ncbi:hypothetical protein BV20DRAFT_779009 [Pilatotrama ljubarskyi]|nr:hypothetical protein BV20DRAFT_779009 [Pilatotrama ljubarskyi]